MCDESELIRGGKPHFVASCTSMYTRAPWWTSEAINVKFPSLKWWGMC